MKFFEDYMRFVGKSEAPTTYHRWSSLGLLGALLGRSIHIPFGHSKIFPNQYILLMGEPGARKSSALNITKELLTKAGYITFAKSRTSPERFFFDLANPKKKEECDFEDISILEEVLQEGDSSKTSDSFICNGEFLDFIGRGNMDFLTVLTNLWDNLPEYEHPKLHGKSVFVSRPTINILGGATVQGLGLAIPPEALGTGILSRMIMVYSDPTGVQITWPEPVAEDASEEIVERLLEIRRMTDGGKEIGRTKGAADILDRMYKEFPGMDDYRFKYYSSRRFTHLLKLTMLISASDLRLEMTSEDALMANTILDNAERRMGRALGEFGGSINCQAANIVMEILDSSTVPLSVSELYKKVARELKDLAELQTLLVNLKYAERVQVIAVGGKSGFMALRKDKKEWGKGLILGDYLGADEL
jgi:hypothetical protein